MHKHHIMPRHLGGSNSPENLVEVSVEEHAKIHRCLWILGGRWQDEVAWRTLSGQITKQEAHRLATQYKSPRHRAKISATLKSKGIMPPSRKGCKMPSWFAEQTRDRMMGNKNTPKGMKWYHDGTKRVWYKP